ncbi:MAG: glycosyltransferase family 2 protein [Sulfuricella sp.]|jgi:rhamnosyltransferase|nr:glycosyltransferase family 2 protein [Sulfuricella sp.]
MIAETKKVCAVVVAYQPDPASFANLLQAVLPQVGGLVVVNNGAAGTIVQPEILEALPYAVLDMGHNAGVAAAQNRGIVWARRHGYSFVIMLDQDSEPAPGMVEKLLNAWMTLDRNGVPVAAVGPRLVDRRDGKASSFVTFTGLGIKESRCVSGRYVPADFLVSSGMLAPVAVYEKVGMLDEGLFIDNVDMDWCFRARRQKLLLHGVCDAVMWHRIGNRVRRLHFFGYSWTIYQHDNPLRQYYIMRNRILLYRRDYTPFPWIVQDVLRAVVKTLIALVFFAQRRMNFRMMLLGMMDGFRGRSGEYSLLRRNNG